MSIFKLILIIGLIVLVFILWKWLKPYFIKHDTTLLFTGGLGAGKTLEAVKTAIILVRKQRFYKYTCYNLIHVKWSNYFRHKINLLKLKKGHKKDIKGMSKNTPQFYNDYLSQHLEIFKKPPLKFNYPRPKPMLYSNMPIHYKTHSWSKKREWAEILQPEHLTLLKKITEYSVILVDEMPQFINQFNWNEDLIQKNVNEFITFFRHYVGGFAIFTSQSESDIVVQVRRKLNQAVWCFDFKKHLFGLFYTNRMCDIMLSDNVATMTTTQIEDNTKLHFGLFPPKHTYDTRCYSIRYQNIFEKANPRTNFDNVKTMNVLRLMEYVSPLDQKTSYEQKQQMYLKIQSYKSVTERSKKTC